MSLAGLGDPNSRFRVYMGNRPDYADLLHLNQIRAVSDGEIQDIGNRCGNGWRKVFNVYAKLVFALDAQMHTDLKDSASWQQWRDSHLLRQQSNSLLLFSRPEPGLLSKDSIHIVMGKGWAKECRLEPELNWINREFALSNRYNLIVCPYFDYRQLSNQKILYLCELIRSLLAENTP